MQKLPSVWSLLLPAYLLGVPPKNLYLIRGVLVVPKTVSEKFARAGARVDKLQENSWITNRSERGGHPVGLVTLLPGHDIESTFVLIREDEANGVIIAVVVDEECALEVHAAENVRPCRRSYDKPKG